MTLNKSHVLHPPLTITHTPMPALRHSRPASAPPSNAAPSAATAVAHSLAAAAPLPMQHPERASSPNPTSVSPSPPWVSRATTRCRCSLGSVTDSQLCSLILPVTAYAAALVQGNQALATGTPKGASCSVRTTPKPKDQPQQPQQLPHPQQPPPPLPPALPPPQRASHLLSPLHLLHHRHSPPPPANSPASSIAVTPRCRAHHLPSTNITHHPPLPPCVPLALHPHPELSLHSHQAHAFSSLKVAEPTKES